MSKLLEYVKPNGVKVQINAESVAAAEALGWKPATKGKAKDDDK
jgi:hypothetical protein